MLQLQTRRQAHLPLADVEEVVARLLPGAIDWGERMSAIIMKHLPQRRRPAPLGEPGLDLCAYFRMMKCSQGARWRAARAAAASAIVRRARIVPTTPRPVARFTLPT